MEFAKLTELSDSLSPEESRKLFVTLTELFANIVADPTKRENLFLPPHAASAVKNPVAHQLLRGKNLSCRGTCGCTHLHHEFAGTTSSLLARIYRQSLTLQDLNSRCWFAHLVRSPGLLWFTAQSETDGEIVAWTSSTKL